MNRGKENEYAALPWPVFVKRVGNFGTSQTCRQFWNLFQDTLALTYATATPFCGDEKAWKKLWNSTICQEQVSKRPLGDWRQRTKYLSLWAPIPVENIVPPVAVMAQFRLLEELSIGITSLEDAQRLAETSFPHLRRLTVRSSMDAEPLQAVKLRMRMPALEELAWLAKDRLPLLEGLLLSCPTLRKVAANVTSAGLADRPPRPRLLRSLSSKLTELYCDKYDMRGFDEISEDETEIALKIFVLEMELTAELERAEEVKRRSSAFSIISRMAERGRLERLSFGLSMAADNVPLMRFLSTPTLQHATLTIATSSEASSVTNHFSESLWLSLCAFTGRTLLIIIRLPSHAGASRFYGDAGGGKRRVQEFARFLDFWIQEAPSWFDKRGTTQLRVIFYQQAFRIAELMKSFHGVLTSHKLLDAPWARTSLHLIEAVRRQATSEMFAFEVERTGNRLLLQRPADFHVRPI